jgi:hypothetical protein
VFKNPLLARKGGHEKMKDILNYGSKTVLKLLISIILSILVLASFIISGYFSFLFFGSGYKEESLNFLLFGGIALIIEAIKVTLAFSKKLTKNIKLLDIFLYGALILSILASYSYLEQNENPATHFIQNFQISNIILIFIIKLFFVSLLEIVLIFVPTVIMSFWIETVETKKKPFKVSNNLKLLLVFITPNFLLTKLVSRINYTHAVLGTSTKQLKLNYNQSETIKLIETKPKLDETLVTEITNYLETNNIYLINIETILKLFEIDKNRWAKIRNLMRDRNLIKVDSKSKKTYFINQKIIRLEDSK